MKPGKYVSHVGTMRLDGGRIVLDVNSKESIELMPTARVSRPQLQAKLGIAGVNIIGTCYTNEDSALLLEVNSLTLAQKASSRRLPLGRH